MKLDIEALARRHHELRAAENSKDKLIEDLLDGIETLEAYFKDATVEVDNQKRLVDSFRKENEKYKLRIDEMHRLQGKLSFVSVLVDGDGMNFLESLVQKGTGGGDKAARLLIKASEDHVQKTTPTIPPNTCYKIRVYANITGLSKAYRADNIMGDDQDLASFIQGFNKADPLCDFVDVGDGKECCDVKMRAHLERDLLDIHCQRVLFCASADNGYASILRQYQYRESNRISLVEGPPFAREMKDLANDFETTSFPEVFMSRKLNDTRRVSSASTVPAYPATSSGASPSPVSPTPKYAAVAAKPAPAPILQFPLTRLSSSPTTNPIKLSLCLNYLGQRVDRRLDISSREVVTALKARKLCNKHHILRKCPHNPCNHDHKPVLGRQELVDLMYIARSTPCDEGLGCRDVTCISGHRCGYGSLCYDKKTCRFGSSMHDIVTTVDIMIEEYELR